MNNTNPIPWPICRPPISDTLVTIFHNDVLRRERKREEYPCMRMYFSHWINIFDTSLPSNTSQNWYYEWSAAVRHTCTVSSTWNWYLHILFLSTYSAWISWMVKEWDKRNTNIPSIVCWCWSADSSYTVEVSHTCT